MITTDRLYRTVRLLGSPFRYRVVGLEHIQDKGPAIYVANHLGSLGPIQMILSLPLRFFPWIIANMTDRQRAPRYLYDDFVRPVLHLQGTMGMVVSFLICQVAVPLLRGLGSIPVEKEFGLFDKSFRRSMDLLIQGRNLLIFPEDNAGPYDPKTQMRPFSCGFSWLCYRYEQATGRPLPIYPVAVSREAAMIVIDRPTFYTNHGDRKQDLRQLCASLQESVHMLRQSLETTLGTSSG
jgi:hypothetical protein